MLYLLPEGWQDFSTELLQAKLDEIAALADKIDLDAAAPVGDDGEPTGPSGLDQAEALADAKDAINGALAERAAEAAAAEERREAVLSRLTEPEADEQVEVEEAQAPAEELAVEEAAAEEPVDAPVAEAPVEETPVVELELAEETPTEDPEPVAVPAAEVEVVPAADKLAAMSAQRTTSELPKPAGQSRNGVMTAVGETTADGWSPGDAFDDLDGLAEFFANKINTGGFLGDWNGPETKIPLMQSQMDFGDRITAADPETNYRVFNDVERQWQEEQRRLASDPENLVAAGAPCAPLMPSYEFISCYDVQRPVEQGLPVVGAPRGGIRYLNPVPLNAESAAAITQKDAAASALLPGAPGYVAKNCTRVSCPTETSVTVGSITRCVTFDNLNFRVFPEQVRNMLERVNVEYTKAKEIFYLNRLDQLAPAAIDIAAAQANPFGAARSLYQDLMQAGHNYRKRNNLSRDAILDVWLPDVVEDVLAVDMTNDHDNGGMATIVGGPSGNLTSALVRKARMNVMFYYYDSSEAGFPQSAHANAAGAWNPFPTTFRSYIYRPGSVVRLNGGSLDLGIVRDSALNADNDLQIFAEEWLEVAHPGCEILSLDHTACYSGVGPNGVAAPACP